jgi:hypothetical protein
MSFIVKNSQLTEDAISAINQIIDMDIDASAAFRLTRIIKELSSIVEDKIKMEKKILDKWVSRDESGNPIVPNGEDGLPIEGTVSIKDPDSFRQEMSILMDTENEIPYEKIRFEDLNLKTAKVKNLIKIEFLFD